MSALAVKQPVKTAPPLEKMPGHWLLAKMGKRVLRPGGVELTRSLLSSLAIDATDNVVEFAPGLGRTAQAAVARRPRSYIAVERNVSAASEVRKHLCGENQICKIGAAEDTGLPGQAASVVYGEAMLSMQSATAKARIVAEASRLLRTGGRYGIHELCLTDDVDDEAAGSIARDLTDKIHVGVKPLTVSQWRQLLADHGFTVVAQQMAPMHLLEPARIIKDEGFWRAIRFAYNVALSCKARRRVWAMRQAFRKHNRHLAAVAIVAVKA